MHSTCDYCLYMWHLNVEQCTVHMENQNTILQRVMLIAFLHLEVMCSMNSSPIFKELKLLKFHDIHSFQLGFFMLSLKNSALPSKFNNLFLINSQIHNTGNAHSFRLPLCRTNTRQFSIYFQGPKFYNSLNSTITGLSFSASFNRRLKEFLLSTY